MADDYADDDDESMVEENVDHSDSDGAEENASDDMSGVENGDNDDEEDEGSMDDDIDVENQISNVSFGTLKKAQETLSRKRKRGSEATADQDSKLESLRTRLQQIRKEKAKDAELQGLNGSKMKSTSSSKSKVNVKVTEDDDEEDDDQEQDSDSDSAPSEEGAGTKARGSKHAPAAQSTKYQVSRKRQVIDVPKRITRDPRFDAMQDQSTQNLNQAKAYSFLREYEESEIAELKAAIKKSRNDDDKETLRRKMVAMQNRHKAKDAADREREVLRRHRKEERERINDGKTPYYLKQKEVKERALVDKFKSMKGKERQKVIDKKRKKESQKEKKRMPQARRME
ncbi:hypothetical protein R9X50_00691700 [Acrodontium crateriforme]|uniref:rRNA biogenesis protein RRP36 n=1 Tax=Acrodontium crateriforme TaxID=150365 RepID=A0AAQ3RDV5_9PEZI|nr:hypothetical protein R9X50_00691700 [Acrodontium crateriforme]